MADIAMWVLEEFVRRERGDELMKRELAEAASMAISAIGSKVGEGVSSLTEAVEGKLEVFEPRSPLGLAAFDGVFSP